jgi:hypothetical protein
MKLPLFCRFIPLITVTLTALVANLPVQAADFQQQEVEQNQFVAIARPYGGNKYDLLILRQIPGQQQCWQESGSNPVVIDPLLLNFDFTGSCERNTDSNGYSIRVNGQDLGLDYLLRVVKHNRELVLVGSSRRNPNFEDIVIGRTRGLSQGFMKFDLDEGWRFTKRVYQGQPLSHVYLTGDRPANKPSRPRPTSQPVSNSQRISPNVNTPSSSSDKVVKELTFTAPVSSQPSQPSRTPPTFPTPPTSEKALASLPTPSPGGYRNPNLLPPPPSPKIPRSFSSETNPSSSGVAYRVMAAVSGQQQQEQVRSLYPDAFATSYRGQRVLQVGVFSTQENATQAYQSLQNAGLRAIMIP